MGILGRSRSRRWHRCCSSLKVKGARVGAGRAGSRAGSPAPGPAVAPSLGPGSFKFVAGAAGGNAPPVTGLAAPAPGPC